MLELTEPVWLFAPLHPPTTPYLLGAEQNATLRTLSGQVKRRTLAATDTRNAQNLSVTPLENDFAINPGVIWPRCAEICVLVLGSQVRFATCGRTNTLWAYLSPACPTSVSWVFCTRIPDLPQFQNKPVWYEIHATCVYCGFRGNPEILSWISESTAGLIIQF